MKEVPFEGKRYFATIPNSAALTHCLNPLSGQLTEEIFESWQHITTIDEQKLKKRVINILGGFLREPPFRYFVYLFIGHGESPAALRFREITNSKMYIEVTTFGEPRIGYQEFSSYLDSVLVVNRITHSDD
ncbi:hypothetical protein G9A89_020127 [Geosiphon pyriformis]|nr:hypothetical protein G9A89_020127 [Geosiphon pyriformis]